MFCKKCAYGNVDSYGNRVRVCDNCIIPELIQENWNYKHSGYPSSEDVIIEMEDENFDPFNR